MMVQAPIQNGLANVYWIGQADGAFQKFLAKWVKYLHDMVPRAHSPTLPYLTVAYHEGRD